MAVTKGQEQILGRLDELERDNAHLQTQLEQVLGGLAILLDGSIDHALINFKDWVLFSINSDDEQCEAEEKLLPLQRINKTQKASGKANKKGKQDLRVAASEASVDEVIPQFDLKEPVSSIAPVLPPQLRSLEKPPELPNTHNSSLQEEATSNKSESMSRTLDLALPSVEIAGCEHKHLILMLDMFVEQEMTELRREIKVLPTPSDGIEDQDVAAIRDNLSQAFFQFVGQRLDDCSEDMISMIRTRVKHQIDSCLQNQKHVLVPALLDHVVDKHS